MPFHKYRSWFVAPFRAEQPAEEVAAHIKRCAMWTLCTGWSWRGLLLLNDATSEDGAFELAVVRETDLLQIESLTVNWMGQSRLQECLTAMDEHPEDFPPLSQTPMRIEQLDTLEEHGRCSLCS